MTTPSASGMFSFLQRVVSKRKGPVETKPRGRHQQPTPGPWVQFSLELIGDTTDIRSPGQALITLQPGQAYQVYVEVIPFEQYVPNAVRLAGEPVELALHSSSSSVQIEATPRHFSVQDLLDQAPLIFQVNLPETCPTEQADLTLTYRELREDRPLLRIAAVAHLPLALQGTYELADPGLVQHCHIALDETTPEYVALLYVEAPAPDKFRLRGWNRLGRLPAIGPIDQDPIGLAGFVEGKIHPRTIRNNVRNFSRRSEPALLNWLQKLIDRHGERLCLIIADHTDAELPWEMLELADDVYLGAEAIVVRWIPVQAYTKTITLHVTGEAYLGDVVAYIDQAELKHTEPEFEALAHLTTTYHQEASQLLLNLQQSLATVGLVYLGCHGIFVYNEKHKVAVGSLHNPTGQVTAVDLEEILDQPGHRPIFFVNACHSARLQRDQRGLFGLPEILLARAAGGYIGTLGPVGSDYAAAIAQHILDAAHTEIDGTQPAEMLRRLRVEAIKQLSNQQLSKKERWLNFLYTFMYVYFGDPLGRLRLNRVVEEEDEDG